MLTRDSLLEVLACVTTTLDYELFNEIFMVMRHVEVKSVLKFVENPTPFNKSIQISITSDDLTEIQFHKKVGQPRPLFY